MVWQFPKRTLKKREHCNWKKTYEEWNIYFKIRPISLNISANQTLYKKWSFQLKISSVNVTKSAVFCSEMYQKTAKLYIDFPTKRTAWRGHVSESKLGVKCVVKSASQRLFFNKWRWRGLIKKISGSFKVYLFANSLFFS